MSTLSPTQAAIGKAQSAGEQKGHGIGPNAVIQLANAIVASHGQALAKQIYADANLLHYLSDEPDRLIDEQEVIRFHRAARKRLGDEFYRERARVAGRLTGDYLLANRIPRLVQWLLSGLPKWLAIKTLNKAIKNNAWTFVGSGHFSISSSGSATLLTIENSPLARDCDRAGGACDFYTATFERLYQQLVDENLTLQEHCCIAAGAENCQFVLK